MCRNCRCNRRWRRGLSGSGIGLNEELEVLNLVAQRLTEADIFYMVTGSVAMSIYATPRMTRNIDIVVAISEEDVSRIVNLYEEEFYIDRDMIIEAIRNEGMFNIIHNEYVVKVDFIVRKSAEYRQVEFDRRRQVRVGSTPLWLVSPEDLVLSKLWWAKDSHSEQQLSDIGNILQQVKELDREYLDKWVQNLGLTEIYQRVGHE